LKIASYSFGLRLAESATFNLQPVTHSWNVHRSRNRASMLTSACLRASGAGPRHSARFEGRMKNEECRILHSVIYLLHSDRARSSKRTVRLISGIALDECRAPERYRTRVPFYFEIAS